MVTTMQLLRLESRNVIAPKNIPVTLVRIQLMVTTDGRTQHQIPAYSKTSSAVLCLVSAMEEPADAIEKQENAW